MPSLNDHFDEATRKIVAQGMIAATRVGDIDNLEHFIRDGVDINIKNEDGITPLMMAAMKGHTSIVRMLIEKEASINEENNDGYNALHLAAHQGHKDAVRLLIDAGAALTAAPGSGFTAEFLAGHNGHTEIVAMLKDAPRRQGRIESEKRRDVAQLEKRTEQSIRDTTARRLEQLRQKRSSVILKKP